MFRPFGVKEHACRTQRRNGASNSVTIRKRCSTEGATNGQAILRRQDAGMVITPKTDVNEVFGKLSRSAVFA